MGRAVEEANKGLLGSSGSQQFYWFLFLVSCSSHPLQSSLVLVSLHVESDQLQEETNPLLIRLFPHSASVTAHKHHYRINF